MSTWKEKTWLLKKQCLKDKNGRRKTAPLTAKKLWFKKIPSQRHVPCNNNQLIFTQHSQKPIQNIVNTYRDTIKLRKTGIALLIDISQKLQTWEILAYHWKEGELIWKRFQERNSHSLIITYIRRWIILNMMLQ